MSAPATTTPIYDYPSHATITRTTWFDQWIDSIAPEFNTRVHVAMRRPNMRQNIFELIEEAEKVRLLYSNTDKVHKYFRAVSVRTFIC